MNSKLSVRVLFGVIFSVILIAIISLIVWVAKPKKQLSIFILDKTVPTKHRYDHRAFSWVVKHEKYAKSNDRLYHKDKDYFGFFPIDNDDKAFDFRSLSLQDIEMVTDTTDLVYFTDTYGVYYSDWSRSNLKVAPEQKIYGGLNQNDYMLLKKMKDNKKTILTEFVLFHGSTSELVQNKTEKLFGFQSEGWIGRYFASLDTADRNNVPPWILNLYQKQNGKEWSYKNPGIILIHKYGKVLVLEEDEALESAIPELVTDKIYAEKYALPEKLHYPYWFDIISTSKQNEVFSGFKLHTTEKGDSLLGAHRLNSSFPAIIRHHGDYRFYYFAGDFADSPVRMWHAHLAGAKHLWPLFYARKQDNRRQFFWKFYNPLMRNILRETHEIND